MSRTSARFDFRKRVAYDAEAKRLFHRHAQHQLKALATALGLAEDQYDLRSNQGGPAVIWNVKTPQIVAATPGIADIIKSACNSLSSGRSNDDNAPKD